MKIRHPSLLIPLLLFILAHASPIQADTASRETSITTGFTGTYEPPESPDENQPVPQANGNQALPQTGSTQTANLTTVGLLLVSLALGLKNYKVKT